MGIMDWLIEKNNQAGQGIRGLGKELLNFNNDVGRNVRDFMGSDLDPARFIPVAGSYISPMYKGMREGNSSGGSPVSGGGNTDYINGNFNKFVQQNNGGRGAFGPESDAVMQNYEGGDTRSGMGGGGGGVEDPMAGLRDRLLAELGNKRSFDDLGFSATLDTSGIDSAHKLSQQQLAEALNRSVQGIGKARNTAKSNYGNASKEIQGYYDANVEDVRNTKGAVQKDANQATNEMKANQAQIMSQLQASDKAMAEEAALRGKSTGGPRSGESDVLQQAQADIAATNSEQINNSVAEKGRREGQVDRNALALQSEGGQAVGNVEALLASALTGYDTRESDVRTANAQASAGLGNQYAGQKLNAEMAQQQAVFNAQNQFQSSEDQRGMSILQMLLSNDQSSQQLAYDQFSAEQEAEAKQMQNASKGDSNMQQKLAEQYFKSLAETDPKKLAEMFQANMK